MGEFDYINLTLTIVLVLSTAWYAYQIYQSNRRAILTNEMEKLVSPLYIHSREIRKNQFFLRGSPSYINDLSPLNQRYLEFWDQINNYKYNRTRLFNSSP